MAQLAYLELPNHDFSESELKFDIQLYNETLEAQFEDEFVFYILPSDSAELRNFDGVDTTTRYCFRFADSDVEYTVFIAKNTEKESQITEALQKAIPVLSVVILAVSIVASFFYTVYMTTPIILHEFERHSEHSELTEQSLHDRALNKGELVEDAVLRQMRDESLHAAIQKLPDKQRRRVTLYYFKGCKIREIAEMEGTTTSNISQSIRKAENNLKKILSEG